MTKADLAEKPEGRAISLESLAENVVFSYSFTLQEGKVAILIQAKIPVDTFIEGFQLLES